MVANFRFNGLVAATLLAFSQAQCDAQTPPGGEVPAIDGFALTWAESFNFTTYEFAVMNGTQYPGGSPNWGTGEIQTYTDAIENVKLTGTGNIAITAIRDANGAWTSARLETVRQDFACLPGKKMRIQGSLSLPNLGPDGIGYWPAFWALGSNFRGNYMNWPSVGEIDIMENVNAINEVTGTLHCGTAPGGPCNENTGLTGNGLPAPGPALQGNMHTYTVEVDRVDPANEAIRWFLDGVQYWEVLMGAVPVDVWEATAHNTYFILLNMAIGGQFPDKVHGAPTPIDTTAPTGTMEVEYVAVYNSI